MTVSPLFVLLHHLTKSDLTDDYIYHTTRVRVQQMQMMIVTDNPGKILYTYQENYRFVIKIITI